jgi:hypothetical protein
VSAVGRRGREVQEQARQGNVQLNKIHEHAPSRRSSYHNAAPFGTCAGPAPWTGGPPAIMQVHCAHCPVHLPTQCPPADVGQELAHRDSGARCATLLGQGTRRQGCQRRAGQNRPRETERRIDDGQMDGYRQRRERERDRRTFWLQRLASVDRGITRMERLGWAWLGCWVAGLLWLLLLRYFCYYWTTGDWRLTKPNQRKQPWPWLVSHLLRPLRIPPERK